MRLGATIAPFAELDPELAVIPWDGTRLIGSDKEELDRYTGLSRWWEKAERLWVERRPDYTSGDLTTRLEYKDGTSKQFPIAPHRVVYTSSGTNLFAARLTDQRALVSETLYWAACSSKDEAQYLTAILNSSTLLDRVKELQAEGQFGRRHFHKVVFAAGFPVYDPAVDLHRNLASAGASAEAFVADLNVAGAGSQRARRTIRKQMASSHIGAAINEMVAELLGAE